jgi:hypothetical protein
MSVVKKAFRRVEPPRLGLCSGQMEGRIDLE